MEPVAPSVIQLDSSTAEEEVLNWLIVVCPNRMMMNDQRASHRKTIKHFHQPGDLHELTFSCYRRLPLLTNDSWRSKLSECIDTACNLTETELVAFVYMPEHGHLLILPTNPQPDIGFFLAQVKQPLSHFIHQELLHTKGRLLDRLMVQERPGKVCFRFWQEGPGYDRNLYSPAAIQASIDYIHMNPVKRGLCKQIIDWKWSSSRYYHLDPPRIQFPSLPFLHGLRVEGLDFDRYR